MLHANGEIIKDTREYEEEKTSFSSN